MKEKLMQLYILSPNGEIFSGKITKVTLPGTLSPFEVLYNHSPIISSLEKGNIVYQDSEGNTRIIKIESGFVKVLDNTIMICVENEVA